jgi:hypothetical protein
MAVSTQTALPAAIELPYPIATSDSNVSQTAYPYPMETMDPTIAAITSFKATKGAEMEMTLTARPTATPLPTYPANAPPCSVSDLTSTLFLGRATGSIILLMSVVNISNSVCTLQGLPNVELLDKNKIPLAVGYYQWEAWSSAAQNGSDNKIGLGPQETVLVRMMWRDWGYRFAGKEVFVRLKLTKDHHLENVTTVDSCGGCIFPDVPSWILVSPFLRSP